MHSLVSKQIVFLFLTVSFPLFNCPERLKIHAEGSDKFFVRQVFLPVRVGWILPRHVLSLLTQSIHDTLGVRLSNLRVKRSFLATLKVYHSLLAILTVALTPTLTHNP